MHPARLSTGAGILYRAHAYNCTKKEKNYEFLILLGYILLCIRIYSVVLPISNENHQSEWGE